MLMKQNSVDIIVAGHICLDIIPNIGVLKDGFHDLLVPGKLIEVGPAITSTGGAVSNTGLALHRLGVKTGFMGKIGNDVFGQAILGLLRAYHQDIADGMIVSHEESSSYTLVMSPPGIDRVFLHCTGANDTFVASDLKLNLIEEATCFHFGYPPLMKQMYIDGGEQLRQIFAQVKRLGLTTSLDLAKPDPESLAGQADWREILTRTLPFVDVFMPSLEEILYMLDRERYDRMCHEFGSSEMIAHIDSTVLMELSAQLLDMGTAIVGIKLGEHGLYVRTTHDFQRLQAIGSYPWINESYVAKQWLAPCFEVNVIGTTGAGDCTIAGFLTGLIRQQSIEDCITAAVAVGAYNVERADAVSGIPAWDDVQLRIRSPWQRKPCTLSLRGWTWNEHSGLYESPVV
jgi:sugar/nucleoside kinase (ribokinase family)